MTQEEIKTLFEITIMIHENKWFGNPKKRRDREEVQEWVAKQLAICNQIYTIPCGMSWAILVSEEEFNNYWNENGKVDKK